MTFYGGRMSMSAHTPRGFRPVLCQQICERLAHESDAYVSILLTVIIEPVKGVGAVSCTESSQHTRQGSSLGLLRCPGT
jgi:hypothetical protein